MSKLSVLDPAGNCSYTVNSSSASLSMAVQSFRTLAAFSVSSSFTQSVGLRGRGSARRKPLPIHRDSNPRTQCSTGRRPYMSWTARPPHVASVCHLKVSGRLETRQICCRKAMPFISALKVGQPLCCQRGMRNDKAVVSVLTAEG
jgi:hypothetical protein